MYLAKLRLICKTVCPERCGQHLHTAHVKLQHGALHSLGKLISCMVDDLQRDTKDLGSGGVGGGKCCR
jgi:hypothetical protein